MPNTAAVVDMNYQLEDRYNRHRGRVFLTGPQALVRLPLMQKWLDEDAGLDTAGFISGYRGSPLGAYDTALWAAKDELKNNHVVFQPGVNEELAATAVAGTQQLSLDKNARHDGVFGIWYGKGPGVDRASDALKHGNAFGSSPHGGVLVIAGDDHGAVSSSFAHQSDHIMSSWRMPILHPADVGEYLTFGLMGIALSRYSGCWVGFKAISEYHDSDGLPPPDRRPTLPLARPLQKHRSPLGQKN
jgi:indolepyruvate ferredoxin oxidoreductase